MATKIIYTLTDEAPMLATYSLLPIINRFTKAAAVTVETRDISVASRVLAAFPEKLQDSQKMSDHLAELGDLAKTPAANIIKLPNISASIPQLKEAIAELQAQGFAVPNYPEDARTDEEKDVQARYKKITGSAVNPVLREGNSDRRAAGSVKDYAKKYPHSMGAWTSESKTSVASMTEGDFFGTERSTVVPGKCDVRIELVTVDGKTQVLKEKIALLPGEVIDASKMSVVALRAFLEEAMQQAQANGVLFSVHLKATMMKVSDPILFGHVVTVFFKDVFKKHGAILKSIGVNPNMGLGDLYKKLAKLPEAKRAEILADLDATAKSRPPLAMVDSSKGITNLHVPSDVIIDASMPKAIRESGQMLAADGSQQDTLAVIPDRSYSGIFQATIDFCREHGAFDPKVMGSVPNVGLMAKAAEEYGSHDKTFEIAGPGSVRIIDVATDEILLEHRVETGDIWRMCQTKDLPIQDWIKLAVSRARASGAPAIFWLNKDRAHDAVLIKKIDEYLPQHDTNGLDIRILPPVDACKLSLERAAGGKDTISVTGNVLRDYNTDLFPILELGTSAKMLSIVPMLAGGGMYETGAGGSAPKHVQQFVEEGHLRWDSLGEFLALQVSLEELAVKNESNKASLLAKALDIANGRFLDANKNPSRKVKEIDNRGSHFYLALYWAEALAAQNEDLELKKEFGALSRVLAENEKNITQELIDCQGQAQDIGGYYHPDPAKVSTVMRPSKTLNTLIDGAPASKI